jgi:hypothetical protein
MLPRDGPDMLLANAIAEDDVDKLKRAIQLGANVCIYSHWPLREACTRVPANLMIVGELLRCGQDEHGNPFGRHGALDSVLSSALSAGNNELLEILLAAVPGPAQSSPLWQTVYQMILTPVLVAARRDDYNLLVTVCTKMLVQELFDSKDFRTIYAITEALTMPPTLARLRAFYTVQRTCFRGELKDCVKQASRRHCALLASDPENHDNLALLETARDAFLMDKRMSAARLGWLVAVANAVRRRPSWEGTGPGPS